ncbi:MAG: hypothetical protein AAGF25_09490 [Pseudomonadota bacterium]
MAVFDGFLVRNSLDDNGSIPSPGYPYYSPDLICHAQVANPGTMFTQDYATDPNQPVETGSKVNYFYVRAKNLSQSTLSGHYISVYRANASLFMRPSIWKNNRLQTQDGQKYVALPTTATNAIAIGNKPFLLDGVASTNFCMIGIASASQNPVVPPDFASYDAYITWVRTNQNICGRNLRTVQSFAVRTYEQLDNFSNPEAVSVPTLFKTTFAGPVAAGSTFGITCAPLNISTSWKIGDGHVETTSGMTPAMFNGNVTTWARTPNGQWPNGVSLNTVAYVGVGASSAAAEFAEVEWEDLDGNAPKSLDGARPHLVQIGNCATVFSTA